MCIILSYQIYLTCGLIYCFPLTSVLYPYIVFEFVQGIPILSQLLLIIGKNATNIFLTHTFLYYYFYTDFIYSFKEPIIILVMLLIFNLLLSAAIELIKRITGYNKLCIYILKKIDNMTEIKRIQN